jgi:hypothetical protein
MNRKKGGEAKWVLWKRGIRSITTPIPIRLIAIISAFFAEGFLVGVDEIAVPGEEIALFLSIRNGLEDRGMEVGHGRREGRGLTV